MIKVGIEIGRVHLVVGELLLDAEAGVVAVEEETRFGEGLVTFCVDDKTQTIARRAFVQMRARNEANLTAITVFFQGLYAPHAFKPIVGIVVSGKEVVLGHHWVVNEMVAVAVHGHEVVVDMTKHHHAAVFAHIPAGVEVEFGHTHRVAKEVEEKFLTLPHFGFLVVDINLSADGLEPVSDRRSAFRHLDGVHPVAWHIIQPKRRGHTSEIGHVFC